MTCSPDLRCWHTAGDILNYRDNGWPELSQQCAFQYPDWIIDGSDILVALRTALNGAHSYHDANQITFMRIGGFRDMIL